MVVVSCHLWISSHISWLKAEPLTSTSSHCCVLGCLFCPLCWPPTLSPPLSCQIQQPLFGVYICWRNPAPWHCFCFNGHRLSLRRRKKRRCSWSLELLKFLTLPSCLDEHEVLLWLSFNMPLVWWMKPKSWQNVKSRDVDLSHLLACLCRACLRTATKC